jgi:hypothetical protein
VSPATVRRIERQAKRIAAHPGWHGVRADRVYLQVPDEHEAWLAYHAAIRQALADLARSEDLYARLAGSAAPEPGAA